MRSIVFLVIVVFSGLIVALGYFIDLPWLTSARQLVLQWAVILAAVALWVGLFNLARVHWGKVIHWKRNSAFSLVLLISMLATLTVGFINRPTGSISLWIFNNVQMPVEASLIAILAVMLVYAAARLLSRRDDFYSLVFTLPVLVMLLGAVSFMDLDIPALFYLRTWIAQVWALGGVRGLLIGIALGTIATALRIFLGADRPYEEQA
jgi:hypothetical protein